MKINDIKDLKKLIQLCQSQGVRAIEVDNIKLELNELPQKQPRYKYIPDSATTPSLSNVDENIQIPQSSIPTDELTEEQLLNWSVGNEQWK